jgi:hypothetical protein
MSAYGYYGMPGSGVQLRQGGQGMSVPMDVPRDVIRIGESTMWSTQRYAAGTALANTSSKVFQVGQGMIGQGFGTQLSLPETNLQTPGQLPAGQAFDIYGIACQPYTLTGTTPDTIYPIVGADMRNFEANLVLRWAFLQTNIDIAPAALVGAGGGIFGDTADTGAADGVGGSRIMLNNGNGQLWVYQEHPVALPAMTQFSIELRWGINAITVDGGENNYALCIRVSLLGKFKSAIPVA